MCCSAFNKMWAEDRISRSISYYYKCNGKCSLYVLHTHVCYTQWAVLQCLSPALVVTCKPIGILHEMVMGLDVTV